MTGPRAPRREAPQSGDRLYRFTFDHCHVRGELVRLDAAWQSMLERRSYPDNAARLLGEAAAATLLAATVKCEGSLTLQTSGDGPISLLVVEATGARTLRGLARWEGELPECTPADLLGDGRLAITIDRGDGRERYQGMVELASDGLAATLQTYFDRSEQIPTRLWLAADHQRAAGLLLQEMPHPGDSPEGEPIWQRLTLLADTLRTEELLGVAPMHLLARLFPEDDVRVYDPQGVAFQCRCSRERVERLLLALGAEEMRQTLAEEGEVSVECEFCSARYRFDAVDIEALFADVPVAPAPRRTH